MFFPDNIDFHMHTTTSDGTDTVETLLPKIIENKIDMFAITDHDAISACDDMRILLKIEERKGAKGLPVFVNGVEFSCEDNYGKYHILGYAYDPYAPAIRELVGFAHDMRMTKLRQRINFLEDRFGIELPQEETQGLFSLKNPGKPHIGNLLAKYGYAENKDVAIRKYLNGITYHGRVHVFPEEAVEAIKNSGGIPVLAHPAYGDGTQRPDDKEMHRRLRALKLCGLMGMEAYYSVFSKEETVRMLSFAKEYDLMVSAGSDYHGANKQVLLGQTGLVSASEGGEQMKAFIKACLERECNY